MSQRKYEVEDEIEINLKVKVNFFSISNYHHLNDEELKNILEDAKYKIKSHLLNEILDEYVVEENLTHMCDYISYKVEEIKE